MKAFLFFFLIILTSLLLSEYPESKPAVAADIRDAGLYKGWRVSAFRIEGIEKELASILKKGLSIPTHFSRLRRRRPVFYPQSLQDDIKRIQLYLARRGYPNALIDPLFEPHPNGKQFSLTLVVDPGLPVRIESIALEGLPPSLEVEARRTLRLTSGSIFSEEDVEAEANTLERKLKQAGFARARVERTVERIDSTRVNIVFRSEPGIVYRFGDTVVEGVSNDLIPLVRKTASVKRGSEYSPLVLERAWDNLRLLDLFRKIHLSTTETAVDTLDVKTDLTSRKPRTAEIGIGYWTDGQLRVRAFWLHRNLFRAGRGLSIGGSASRFLQTGNLSFWWPALVGARTREALSAKLEYQLEDSYDLLSAGGELSSSYHHSFATTTRISLDVSNVDVTVKTENKEAFVDKGGLLTALVLRLMRNATDNRVSPTRGSITWIKTEWAPNGFLSDSHYASLEASGSRFFPLSENALLAGRITVGIAEPTGESIDLLPNKRFYSGGANSMRGFERRKLGPLDSEGAPLGGESKIETSVEIRAPLVWRFQWSLFLDAGQVWPTIEDMKIDEMEAAAGPGLMLRTPVGPIRFDVGRRLTYREQTQPRWVFHLSIGHPF